MNSQEKFEKLSEIFAYREFTQAEIDGMTEAVKHLGRRRAKYFTHNGVNFHVTIKSINNGFYAILVNEKTGEEIEISGEVITDGRTAVKFGTGGVLQYAMMMAEDTAVITPAVVKPAPVKIVSSISKFIRPFNA